MWVNISNCPAHLEWLPCIIEPWWFTWSHNSFLQLLVQQMLPTLSKEAKLYVDLLGYHATDNLLATIPMQYTITSTRPNIVIIKNGKVHLIELTIPFNSMKEIKNGWIRMGEKTNYQLVLSNLDARGVHSSLTTLEIRALGHSLQVANVGLRKLFSEAPKQSLSIC